MLTPARRSRAYFKSGLYCAESVLLAIADEWGLSSKYIPRIATGFCGGMALTGGGVRRPDRGDHGLGTALWPQQRY